MYNYVPLMEELETIFKDKKILDLKTKVLIPSSNLSHKSPKTFKSPYTVANPTPEYFQLDKDFLLRDIAMASSVAPYYFKPKEIGCQFFWDGGLWANNPSLCGYIEAKRICQGQANIKILSLGTGSQYQEYVAHKNLSKRGPIDPTFVIPYIIDIQSQAISNQLQMLLGPEDIYKRVDCGFTCDMPLDDISCIKDLVGKAKEMTQKNITDVLVKFFN